MGYLGPYVLGESRQGWAYGRRWRSRGDWDETSKAVVVCSIRTGNAMRLYFSSMGAGVIEGFQVEGSTRGRGYIITRGWDLDRRDNCFHM